MKILLLGNAGSGKSTMAARLAAGGGVARLSLDDIAWDEGTTRKPLAESRRLLLEFIGAHGRWVIEGCYGDLVEAALPFCTELRFLNPGVETCVRHCRARPWEPEKFASPAEQAAALAPLIEWVRAYESRDDEFGLARHRALFDACDGTRREYRRVEDYEAG